MDLKYNVYSIVKLKVHGNIFDGDACNCFDGMEVEEDNLEKARHYWNNNVKNEKPVIDTLVDGEITVDEIVEDFHMDIGNYAKHARIWDWGGHDDTNEYEYWCKYASAYGQHVLIPMCALGQTGAYLAEHGFDVTAFDITQEMIDEGKKRFGPIQGLSLLHGDIRDFSFQIPPVDFCYIKDLGHLHSIEDVGKAFAAISRHMRAGGGLIIEIGLPYTESKYFPPQAFHPLKQVYPGLKVWKTGDTRHDAQTGQCHLSQKVYIEDETGAVEQFDHSFYLQSYPREELIQALAESGFTVKAEYRSRDQEPWREGDGFWIVEACKRDNCL